MDVQQLTLPATGRPAGFGPLPDALPWWEEEGGSDRFDAAPAGGRPAARSVSRILIAILALAALIVCVEAAVGLLTGMRWFVVQTPSMGTAAPVGSLVVTRPATTAPQPGEIIAFRPPGAARVYTHRVVAIAPDGGITTKGDINGAPDGWTIRRSAVLGTAVAVVPGGGTLLRGAPAFIVGALVLWAATLPIRRRDRRAAARVIGLHLVGTLVVLWLHPFVQVVLLATDGAAKGMHASIVSTGLLPVKLVDTAGTVLARLTVGRPAVVTIPSSGADRLAAMPDLGPVLQLALIGVAFVPALVVLLVGLPRDPGAVA